MTTEVRASHILVESKDKAQKVKNQLDNGKSFEKLAKETSECPSSEKGGDLGYFSQGDMVKPFERKVFNMSEDEISEPVKTEFGWHIIKKTDQR